MLHEFESNGPKEVDRFLSIRIESPPCSNPFVKLTSRFVTENNLNLDTSRTVCLMIGLTLSGCYPTTVAYDSTSRSAPLVTRKRPAAPHPSLQITPPAVVENSWRPKVDAREWRHIVIHHTATDSGSVERIHESHVKKGWLGIGYHFLIGNGNGMADGVVEPTFRWRQQLHGAHAGKDEYNQHGIGICLVGNFQETDPTEGQLAAVKQLVAALRDEYSIPSSRVIGHNEVKATACPGQNFPLTQVSQSSLRPELVQFSRPIPRVAEAEGNGE